MLNSFCNDIYEMISRRHPNSKIFCIGDEHFYHANIINYTRPQFVDALEMNEAIIRKHNEVVGPDDIVIFLGDFAFKKTYIKELNQRLNGHKYLVLGNHDSDDLLKCYPDLGFEGVYTSPVKIQDRYFSHEPLIDGQRSDLQFGCIVNEFYKCTGASNFHGHIHEKSNLGEKYINATCEVLDYKPLYVGSTTKVSDSPLFINSPYFSDTLSFLAQKCGIDPRILIADYLYAYILEQLQSFKNNFFVQGSYGLFKKYGFISLFSDLDISHFSNPNISKRRNSDTLKDFVDTSYEALKQIDGIDLYFYKRYAALRLYVSSFTSQSSYHVKAVLDANLILLDSYKDSDFLSLNRQTMMQRLLTKNGVDYPDYTFPSFDANFLVPEGDIANLVLQILFQQNREADRRLALRKLQYVYKIKFADDQMQDFDNILSRFFLRNIALLHTLHRYGEIEYIHEALNDIKGLLNKFPTSLKEKIYDLLNNSDSEFLDIYQEICLTSPENSFEVCERRTRSLK